MKTAGTFFLKRDDWRLGVVLGILAPLLIFLIIYKIRFDFMDLGEFIAALFKERSIITFVGVWCTLGNIALFTYYTNTDRHLTARGLFIVTVVVGIGVLLVKALI
ncbi:hypothetical protein [Flaviaesturariibacter amylovorans]|uniref:Sulfate exporter family transporter n=1 Tax=Flaviaesturariibacter amylovorans TaxID=1084520 RepID=A0ABP8H849_9BACT